MPWAHRCRPCPGIAALVAYVRRERPQFAVAARSEYVDLSLRMDRDLYDLVAEDAYRTGELMYAPILYPAAREAVRDRFCQWGRVEKVAGHLPARFNEIFQMLSDGVDSLVDEIADDTDVVGFTTSFGQLFANLAVARALKRRKPGIRTVLGGSTVSGAAGPSLLREYPFVDHVIQGEGERPLIALLDAIAAGQPPPGPELGILSQAAPAPAKLVEIPSMDELPPPDYDEYAERATTHGIDWALPIEGSRGCWWDRTRRHGNPRATCYFCNLNVQWNGYREKSVDRLVGEVVALSERYENLKIYFVDNIIRIQGADELADAIERTGKQFEIFYEMRANLSAWEFLRLWEAGLRITQFGIEGLSSRYLRRIGKGTTTVQNLQAMRLCTEFRVVNAGNLIIDFPGATEAEVQETRETILSYALSFRPLAITRFHLGLESTVEVQPESFGITRVRNDDAYRIAIPEEVLARLRLPDLSFDLVAPGVEWKPVTEACEKWRELHRTIDAEKAEPLLVYRDGGSFLTVEDQRFGDLRSGTAKGLERELYLYCMEVRSMGQLVRRFGDERAIRDILAGFVDNRILFAEDDHFLSLAVAARPDLAARRIREQHAQQLQAQKTRQISLPVHP